MLQNFALHIFFISGLHAFFVWTPQFGWTPRLNYTMMEHNRPLLNETPFQK